jgi:SAM-dependent methyltransferase
MKSKQQAFLDRYKIGPEYLSAYLDYWNRNNPDLPIRCLADMENIPADRRAWVDYALTTNLRGEEFVQAFEKSLPSAGGRVATLQCEFGGVLCALKQRGLDAWAITTDPQTAVFARANARDRGIEERVVESASPFEFSPALGPFDGILANKAIETSLEPQELLSQWAKRLRPGGRLVMEIPNKYSLDFVAADRHANLFGLTLLAPEDAKAYCTARGGGSLALGRLLTLAQYQNAAEDAGFQAEAVANPFTVARKLSECGRLVDEAVMAYQRFMKGDKNKAPLAIQVKLDVLFRKYLAGMTQDLADAHQGPDRLDAFERKYLIQYWTLLLCRPGQAATSPDHA